MVPVLPLTQCSACNSESSHPSPSGGEQKCTHLSTWVRPRECARSIMNARSKQHLVFAVLLFGTTRSVGIRSARLNGKAAADAIHLYTSPFVRHETKEAASEGPTLALLGVSPLVWGKMIDFDVTSVSFAFTTRVAILLFIVVGVGAPSLAIARCVCLHGRQSPVSFSLSCCIMLRLILPQRRQRAYLALYRSFFRRTFALKSPP